jgi:simple sugar transport system permease protein
VSETNSDARGSFHRFLSAYFAAAPVLVPVYAIVLAVVVGGLVIVAIGDNPFAAYWALLRGMFGTFDRTAASLGRSTPFIGAALAVAFAFRAGLFNIGAEGQLLVGATVAAWIGTWSLVADLPGVLAIAVVLVAGAVGGGVFGSVPGWLKARTGAHEVITTIMLNNIAIIGVRWMVASQDPIVMRDMTASVPRTRTLPNGARLPVFVDSEPPLHLSFAIMAALAAFVWFVLQRTTTGFEIRAVGQNPSAAQYAGMRVGATIVLVMTLAGAFAGVAGAGEVSGTSGFLSPGVFAAVGFDSIAIALLARANPFAVIPAALLWGSMLSGAALMQQETGISIDIVRIVQALVLLFVAADVIVRWLFGLRRAATANAQPEIASGWGATT